MQPDENTPSGISDSVISGDIHHHHYQPNITQEPQNIQPQSVMIDPYTGLPQNVIIMQQPSSAPVVVGIFVIIYGAISLIGSLLGLLGSTFLASEIDDKVLEEYALQLVVFSSFSFLIAVGTIVSGVFINKRQTKGIHLAWVTIAAGLLLSIIQQIIIPAELSDPSGLGQTIGIGFSVVCNGICGLIVAIPLMVTDSGMDDSRLML